MRFGGGSKEIWHVNVKALGKNAWSLLDVPSPSSGEIYFSFFFARVALFEQDAQQGVCLFLLGICGG